MSSSIKRAKTSEIWNYFTPIPSENFIANCNICKRKLSFKTTNSNLKKHLTSNHPTIALPSSTKGHQNLQRHQEQEQQQQQDPQPSQQQALTDVSDSTEIAEEWNLCRELTTILQPLEKVTKLISTEQFPSASLVIPLVNGLIDVYKKLFNKTFTKDAENVIGKIQFGLQSRFEHIEVSNTLSLSTFLDPRFKMIGFANQNCAENAKKKVISGVANFIESQSREDVGNTKEMNIPIDDDVDDDLSIWNLFK
ncbi:finger protein putative-related [Holotrichia oblita]|uniref:Finger protein putative-related n=1 Tax=Holotrichia oblita TaxID=644536 RepID=A0ACB9SJN2_HOLOL|nr:finger protein putative-related [Holotrichia oblita]